MSVLASFLVVIPLVGAEPSPGATAGPPTAKPYAGVPYRDSVHPGGPQLIPGRLQNEYYDQLDVSDEEKARGAGEMVTYHDTDNQNSGSGALNDSGSYLDQFRMRESPDISYVKFDHPRTPIDDSPFNLVTPDRNALYLGWIAPGEWVKYTVLVEVEGFYSLTILYTSKFGGGISLDSDGVAVSGEIDLPSTFDAADPVDWRQAHHWNRLTKAGRFFLRKGPQVLTLHFLRNPVMNFDYMEFVPVE